MAKLMQAQRWRVEQCGREADQTWSQTWWTTYPIDSRGYSVAGWSDFPTWRDALAYVRGQLAGQPDGLTHDGDCWCHGCRMARELAWQRRPRT